MRWPKITTESAKALAKTIPGGLWRNQTVWATLAVAAGINLPPAGRTWMVGIALALSFIPRIRMQAMSFAITATTLGLLQTPEPGKTTTAEILTPIAWAIWALLSNQNGLEKNLSGVLWAAAAFFALATDPGGRVNILYITASGLALIAGGGINRTAIGAACLLVLSPAATPIHKNTRARTMVQAAGCLLASPGIVPKLAAVLPTWDTLKPAFFKQEEDRENTPPGTTPKPTSREVVEIGFTPENPATASVALACMWAVWIVGSLGEKIPKKKYLWIAGAAAGTVLLISLPWTAPPALKLLARDNTLTGRTAIWKIIAPLIAEKPWTGWTAGFWSGLGRELGEIEALWEGGASSAHNSYIETAVRHGIPAALLVLAAVGTGIFHRNNTWKERGIFVSVWLNSLTESYPWEHQPEKTYSGNSSVFPPAGSAAASVRDNPQRWWVPPKMAVRIAIATASIWALAAWALLPKADTYREEIWVSQSGKTSLLTGPNWFSQSRAILDAGRKITKDKIHFPTLRADRSRGGNIIRAQAETEAELDAFADAVKAKGFVFVRAIRQQVSINQTPRAIILALAPLALVGLFLLGGAKEEHKARTLVACGLILCGVLVQRPPQKEETETVALGRIATELIFPDIFGVHDKFHTRNVLMSDLGRLDPARAGINCDMHWTNRLDDTVHLKLRAPRDPEDKNPIPTITDMLILYEPIRREIEAMPQATP